MPWRFRLHGILTLMIYDDEEMVCIGVDDEGNHLARL